MLDFPSFPGRGSKTFQECLDIASWKMLYNLHIRRRKTYPLNLFDLFLMSSFWIVHVYLVGRHLFKVENTQHLFELSSDEWKACGRKAARPDASCCTSSHDSWFVWWTKSSYRGYPFGTAKTQSKHKKGIFIMYTDARFCLSTIGAMD